ncbi:MAG TPA: hypothetical protein VEK08_18075, partial [Planctomycetota bacterium]|nr:hypothetical protein [Planctomycetota bacterium]
PANLGYTGPQTPIDFDGRRYLTSAFNTNPTNGASTVGIWILRDQVAVPATAFGDARNWPLLSKEPFSSLRPATDKREKRDKPVLFLWCDANEDGGVQPDELSFKEVNGYSSGTTYVTRDLMLINSFTEQLKPVRFTPKGVPIYDLQQFKALIPGLTHRFTSGGGEAFPAENGWTIVTGGPMRGYRNGELAWTYQSRWPGLHPSHEAPQRAQAPGEMIGTTRLLGHTVKPKAGEAGELWAVNGNAGVIYLMTTDGLFVSTLGRDRFTGTPWPQTAERGADLSNVWFNDEHFWPTINQCSDGSIYLVIGKNHSSIVRVDGLDSIRRLPEQALNVTPELLAQAESYRLAQEKLRQQNKGRQSLSITLRDSAPVVDGNLNEWDPARFVTIYSDKYDRKPVKIEGALAVSGDRLFAAFNAFDKDLLNNGGDTLNMLFKTGGALDLMLAANGNERLLVTRMKNKTAAVLYRQKVEGTSADKRVPFASPTRSVYFDRVDDVSDSVQLASSPGAYEFSIPLSILGITAREGETLFGDIGVLRGQNGATTQRLYWHNKATSITADVPSEAMLTPQLWGEMKVVK